MCLHCKLGPFDSAVLANSPHRGWDRPIVSRQTLKKSPIAINTIGDSSKHYHFEQIRA